MIVAMITCAYQLHVSCPGREPDFTSYTKSISKYFTEKNNLLKFSSSFGYFSSFSSETDHWAFCVGGQCYICLIVRVQLIIYINGKDKFGGSGTKSVEHKRFGWVNSAFSPPTTRHRTLGSPSTPGLLPWGYIKNQKFQII